MEITLQLSVPLATEVPVVEVLETAVISLFREVPVRLGKETVAEPVGPLGFGPEVVEAVLEGSEKVPQHQTVVEPVVLEYREVLLEPQPITQEAAVAAVAGNLEPQRFQAVSAAVEEVLQITANSLAEG